MLAGRHIIRTHCHHHQRVNVAASASGGLFGRLASVFTPSSKRQGTMTAAAQKFTDNKWWDSNTVAVVTGANKGIGKDIARQLAGQGLKVIATSRNEELGKAAVEEISTDAADGGSVLYHQLDIADAASIAVFKEWLAKEYGSFTILINNAGFAYKGDVFGPQELRATLAINYFGTANVTEALLPLLKPNLGRVVTVSSRAGSSSILKSQDLQNRFLAAKSKADIDALVGEFVTLVDKEPSGSSLASAGWPRSMYGVSKLGISSYCRMLAEQVADRGIKVAACCPGYVATDMSSHRGTKTTAQGADTPVWLALQPSAQLPSGKKWAERQQIAY